MALISYISHAPETAAAASVLLPYSKSVSARVACLDFLSGGRVRMHSHPSDDEAVIANALRCFELNKPADIHASGTALRLLTAIAASRPGLTTRLHGSSRLLSRPMAPLLNALNLLGAKEIHTVGKNDIIIEGSKLRGTEITIDASISSQFATALLLIAPLIEGGMRLRLAGGLSSPYIDMTLALMRRYGAHILQYDNIIEIAEQAYVYPADYYCEYCASSASYFLELEKITGRQINFFNLEKRPPCLQGDAAAIPLFKAPIEGTISMYDTPDLVPAYAAMCAALQTDCRILGVRRLAYKESNRLTALRDELSKFGAKITISEDELCIRAASLHAPDAPIETHADHRIAMALTPLAACVGAFEMRDTNVVEKSFPTFWREMAKIGICKEH